MARHYPKPEDRASAEERFEAWLDVQKEAFVSDPVTFMKVLSRACRVDTRSLSRILPKLAVQGLIGTLKCGKGQFYWIGVAPPGVEFAFIDYHDLASRFSGTIAATMGRRRTARAA